MKNLSRFIAIALTTIFTTFYSLIQSGKLESAFKMLQVVIPFYLILLVVCALTKRKWG
jgi:hypothetical protein